MVVVLVLLLIVVVVMVLLLLMMFFCVTVVNINAAANKGGFYTNAVDSDESANADCCCSVNAINNGEVGHPPPKNSRPF